MRGKLPAQAGELPHDSLASMRPAHYAREVPQRVDVRQRSVEASMRPAHYAREVLDSLTAAYIPCGASMRPAHYAREVSKPRRRPGGGRRSFNEARALCAGSSANGRGH